MKVISFPGCHQPVEHNAEGRHQTLSETDLRRLAFIRSFDALDKPDLAGEETQTVRDFALSFAEKLRCDPDLNSQAPLLVDKVVMMLVKESRS